MIIVLAALLLTGCATLPPPPVARAVYPAGAESTAKVTLTDHAALLNVEWQLIEIRLSADSPLVVDNPAHYTLEFADDGTVGGQLDCNRMTGTFTLNGDKLVFGLIASTKAFCPENAVFPVYSMALNTATSYAIVDGHLQITYGGDEGVLIYAPAAESVGGAAVTETALANGSYAGIYDELVQLTDGAFAGEPFVAGGASRPTVTLVPDTTALGDLNGDGVADGVAVLVENSGGSGSFVYLATLLVGMDTPGQGVTLLLGDRVRIESVAIVDDQIEMVAGTFADTDPMCCPSLRTRSVYALKHGALVELSAEKL